MEENIETEKIILVNYRPHLHKKKIHPPVTEQMFKEGWRELTLSKGYVTKVDAKDFSELSRWMWGASEARGLVYAVTGQWIPEKQGYKRIYLHTYLMGIRNGFVVDHESGDSLDNRRDNLRWSTVQQNAQNQKARNNITGKFKGVGWCKREEKWRARISINRKDITLGYFNTELEAALAYDKAAKQYFGEFARLNFPDIKDIPT